MNSRLSEFGGEAEILAAKCKKSVRRVTTWAAVATGFAIVFFVLFVVLSVIASNKKKNSGSKSK